MSKMYYLKAYRKIYYLPIYLLYKLLNYGYSQFKREMNIRRYDIHESVKFWHNTYFAGNGRITVKKNTYFGQQTFITANPKESQIIIGENCMISHDVHIRTETYDPQNLDLDFRKKKFGNIVIGDNVFIGKGVYIKGGVEIGNNVTIGANSVVTKSIEPYSIIGGIPAKSLRK